MSDHDFTQESLDAYHAGGLSADERAAVEKHLADCADCRAVLARARKLELVMRGIFTDARPAANLEQRALSRVRRVPGRLPRWVHYAMGAAAVFALAFVGAVVQAIATDGTPSSFLAFNARTYSTNNLKQVGANSTFTTVGQKIAAESLDEKKATFSTVDVDPAATRFDTDIQYMTDRISNLSVPGSTNPNEAAGIIAGDRPADPVNLPAPGGFGKKSRLSPEVTNGELHDGRLAGTFYGRSGVTRGLDETKRKEKAVLSIPEDELLPELGFRTTSPSYFKPGDKSPPSPPRGTNPPTPPVPMPALGVNKPPAGESRGEVDKKLGADQDFDKLNLKLVQTQPEPPPADAGRKIIRTGDIDFETESFDNAVKTIHRLIGGIKGKAFVATVNSDKLPNGKMRGAVVVRMQPIYLDQFIEDLRTEIGKTGELKSQRIGSQDVTKQYTDVDSELRAARAVEERFLRIIKDGKGEIKDLVAAERELGLWRTKIEKMEGEKRYYDSQIALSTLTINLTEKEIETPFALVRTEKVQMRLEVDDVKKALENAVASVDALKGRVLKSESKQHKAGQFEAILHAEIPAPQKDAFRKELSRLGLVSDDEATQKTQAEGGTGKPREMKQRVNDIIFEVTLNNIVNIQPRHSVTIDIVSDKVAAGYAKVQDAVNRISKGQIRVANLNEPDKHRVTAVIDFNVPKEQKEAIDKLIVEIGPVLKKTKVQSPVTEVATEQKFGFVINLYSVAVIAPRERVMLRLQVEDVAAKASEIETLARTAKGQVERGEFIQSTGGQVSLVVAVHVPLASSDTLITQFMKGSKVLDRKQTPNPQAPENELATSLIIVTLTEGSPIVPTDEGLPAKLRSGIYWAFTALAWSAIIVMTGVLVIAPWILVFWLAIKLVMWMWQSPAKTVTSVPASPEVKPTT